MKHAFHVCKVEFYNSLMTSTTKETPWQKDSCCDAVVTSRSLKKCDNISVPSMERKQPITKRRARRKSSILSRDPLTAKSQNSITKRANSKHSSVSQKGNDFVGKEIHFRRRSSVASEQSLGNTHPSEKTTTSSLHGNSKEEDKTRRSSQDATRKEDSSPYDTDLGRKPVSLFAILGGTAPPLDPSSPSPSPPQSNSNKKKAAPTMTMFPDWREGSSPLLVKHRPRRTDSRTLLLPIPSLREEKSTPPPEIPEKPNLSTLLENSVNVDDKLAELNDENEKLTSELQDLRNDHNAATTSLRDLNAENARLKRDNELLQGQVERLSSSETDTLGWLSDFRAHIDGGLHMAVEKVKEVLETNRDLHNRITELETALVDSTNGQATRQQHRTREALPPAPSLRPPTATDPVAIKKDECLSGSLYNGNLITVRRSRHSSFSTITTSSPGTLGVSPNEDVAPDLEYRDNGDDHSNDWSTSTRRQQMPPLVSTEQKHEHGALPEENACTFLASEQAPLLDPGSVNNDQTASGNVDSNDSDAIDKHDDSSPVYSRRRRTDSSTLLLPVPSLREDSSTPNPPSSEEKTGREEEITREYVPPVKINDKTLLYPLVEEENCTVHGQSEELLSLQNRADALLIENKKLTNQIKSMQKDYEERVTPFRDVFEDKRELQARVDTLNGEMQRLRLQNARLSQDNEEFNTSIEQLQAQMTQAVQKAFARVNALTRENSELKERNAKLESEFASAD